MTDKTDFNNKYIVELLEDTAFPSMILVDGEWGSGKTHYIREVLTPFLKERFKEESIHSFSLYGVSDVNDFRDRITSICLSGSEETSKLTTNLIKIADSIGLSNDTKGISGVLSGAAGAYRYSMYKELSNKILIIDDLERVASVNAIKVILGECFNLADTRNNIKVIVVANTKKVDVTADLEKVFCDKITIKYSSKEIVNFLKDEYQDVL